MRIARFSLRVGVAFGILLTAGSAVAFNPDSQLLSVGVPPSGAARPIVNPATDQAAALFATHIYAAPGNFAPQYFTSPLSTQRLGNSWSLVNLAGGTIDANAAFNLIGFRAGNVNVITVTANAQNTQGHMLTVDEPRLNGQAKAGLIVQATSTTQARDPHRVGVWFNGTKWVIFNENQQPIPAGSQFFLLYAPSAQILTVPTLPPAQASHYITLPNQPARVKAGASAKILVTHNFGAAGIAKSSVYLDKPIGLWYTGPQNGWALYDETQTKLPAGATFNVDYNFNDSI